jgi:DNA-binding SARP family transcriptional activator
VRYELLGPLRIVDSDGPAFITAPKVELLLAVLLIRANRPTSTDRLVDEIWLDNPPRRATAGLHVYVSQLRKFLDRPGESHSAIVTRAAGYVLELGADELDLSIFLNAMDRGRESAKTGQIDLAAKNFEHALGLWRGDALAALPSRPIISGFLNWLGEKRLECAELAVEAQLLLGGHREMIARLYSLIGRYPLREAFYRQLMLALYRSERQADALKLYQSVRETLDRELGVHPGRSLQELQQAILAADPDLDTPRPHLLLLSG